MQAFQLFQKFITKNNKLNHTCRQSRAATTIRGHFDWQASSNGKKYLSASINGCFPFGGGRADDGLSSLCNKKRTTNALFFILKLR